MYWTKSPGTGGELLSEADFVVEEMPLKKFFLRYARSAGGVSPMNGRYFLYKLKKRGMTTKAAVNLLQRKFGAEIGYAGLKDKFAVTTQYLTMRKDIPDFSLDDLELTKVGTTNNFMQIGELEGNKFTITLHNCSVRRAKKVIEELENRGIPNYFGKQRFGLHGNHEIGKALIKNEFDRALELINSGGQKYTSLNSVDKKTLKFYIHAYQSFLFNKLLDEYVKMQKPFYGDFPVPGFDTRLSSSTTMKKILEKEGIGQKNFRIGHLSVMCRGAVRRAFVSVKNINYKVEGDNIILGFSLPPGSYATIVLREVTKNGRF